MTKINYSILINKAIQNYNIEKGYDKNYELWKTAIIPFYINTSDSLNLCCRLVRGQNGVCSLRLFDKTKGTYEITNINDDYSLFYINGKSKSKFISQKIYDIEDIDNVFLIALQNPNNEKKLIIFKDGIEIFEEKNVEKFEFDGKEKITFVKILDSDSADLYEMNISNMNKNKISTISLDNYDFNKIRKVFYISRKYFDNQKYIKFYISYQESKYFYILFDYATKKAKQISIIKNDIKHDNAINYEICFDREQMEEIEYFFYLTYYKEPQYLYILGYPIFILAKYLQYNDVDREILYNSDMNYKNIFDTIEMLKNTVGCSTNSDMLQYLINKYGEINLCEYMMRKDPYIAFIKPVIENNDNTYKSYFKKYDSKIEDDYNNLISSSNVYAKWKSESKLYRLVKSVYPDAIYQYHDKWLGSQSLDIFVPSIKLGIEYQGLQHYHAVDFFGGEKVFAETVERDKRKNELCKKNGITIIYWMYNEGINYSLLNEKLVLNGYDNLKYEEKKINQFDELEEEAMKDYCCFNKLSKVNME